MRKLLQMLVVLLFCLLIATAASSAFSGIDPEPATMFLFGIGLIGLSALGRRHVGQRDKAGKDAPISRLQTETKAPFGS